MVRVPAVLDVDDAHVGAGAAGERRRVDGIDTIGCRVAVDLLPREVGGHRHGCGTRLSIRSLDDVQRLQIGDHAVDIGPRAQTQAIPQIEIGRFTASACLGATPLRIQFRLWPGE